MEIQSTICSQANNRSDLESQTIVEMAENHLMNLPLPIVIDILARLPPKTVLLCRCVCRAWLHLLCHPEFVDLHLSKSPTWLFVCKMSSSPSRVTSFSIAELEDESCQGVRYIAGMNREIPRSLPNTFVKVIGSIDGLVCINEYSYRCDCELIHVWNPITREFISIQPPGGSQMYPDVTTYGFGISSGKYQVVRIVQEISKTQQIQNSTCYVYTIGAGLWKNIGHAPYLYRYTGRGLFLNGNLHWLIYDQALISCLDLEKELFQPFPARPGLRKRYPASLNVCNGFLSMCDMSPDLNMEIWVMKEYGVKNSWSKEVVISNHLMDQSGIAFDIVRIVRVFKDGEVLLLWGNEYLFSYHLERINVHNLNIQESLIGPSSNGNHNVRYTYVGAQDYVPSFVSLKIGEEKVQKVVS